MRRRDWLSGDQPLPAAPQGFVPTPGSRKDLRWAAKHPRLTLHGTPITPRLRVAQIACKPLDSAGLETQLWVQLRYGKLPKAWPSSNAVPSQVQFGKSFSHSEIPPPSGSHSAGWGQEGQEGIPHSGKKWTLCTTVTTTLSNTLECENLTRLIPAGHHLSSPSSGHSQGYLCFCAAVGGLVRPRVRQRERVRGGGALL